MRIKDFLNEFEADRAALPGVEKETLAKLSRAMEMMIKVSGLILL